MADESRSPDPVSRGFDRRRFVKGLAGAAAGFLGIGRALLSPGKALAANQCVDVYCYLYDSHCSGGTYVVIEHCRDVYTGAYCFQRVYTAGCC